MEDKLETFKDPTNVPELIRGIRKLIPGRNVIDTVNQYYPNWITSILVGYSPDYPRFKKNWETICNSLEDVKPRDIVLVELVYEDVILNGSPPDNYNLLIAACDILTYKGYCIRRKGEFIPCEICGLAIPSKAVYDFMKQKKIKCPKRWKNRCSGCTI